MNRCNLAFRTQRLGAGTWLLGTARSRLASILAILALTLAVASLGWVAVRCNDALDERAQAQQSAQALRNETDRVTRRRIPKSTPLLPAAQVRVWNQMARHLNTPWPAILDALEAATPETVALVSVEPDTRNGSIRLQAEAKALDTLLAYAGTLQTLDPFGEALLVRHETNDRDSTRPVRLSIDVRLRAP